MSRLKILFNSGLALGVAFVSMWMSSWLINFLLSKLGTFSSVKLVLSINVASIIIGCWIAGLIRRDSMGVYKILPLPKREFLIFLFTLVAVTLTVILSIAISSGGSITVSVVDFGSSIHLDRETFDFVAQVLVGVIFEEFFYRYLFVSTLGVRLGGVVSVALFCFTHRLDQWYFILSGGLLFLSLFLLYKSPWPSIACHFGCNIAIYSLFSSNPLVHPRVLPSEVEYIFHWLFTFIAVAISVVAYRFIFISSLRSGENKSS